MRFGFCLAAWLLLTIGAAAQQAGDLYEGDRFAVKKERLAADIYVLRREPSWRLPVQANTTVIVNESDVVLVDGGFGAHAEKIVEAVREITDKPVSVIVNTHWHGDHNVGHYVFKREWPKARIIAHENTRAAMADGVMEYVARTGAIEDDEELVESLRTRLAALRKENGPPGLIAYTVDAIRGLPAVRDDYARWEMKLADETFRDRFVLHRGDRRIEILHFGRANTEGDAIVWLPEERIAATGDVVVWPTPYGFGSFPAEWGDVLRAVNALDYDILIPGHGKVQRDKAYVSQLAGLMDDVARQAKTAIEGGAEDGEAVFELIDWSSHDAAFAGEDPLLQRLFEVWFKRPISLAAYNELAPEREADE